jgi:hypothetical protein
MRLIENVGDDVKMLAHRLALRSEWPVADMMIFERNQG